MGPTEGRRLREPELAGRCHHPDDRGCSSAVHRVLLRRERHPDARQDHRARHQGVRRDHQDRDYPVHRVRPSDVHWGCSVRAGREAAELVGR